MRVAEASSVRVKRLEALFEKIIPVPREWLKTTAKQTAKTGGRTELGCAPCSSWRELVMAWRKALKWTDGLEHALACMLASIISVRQVGDQLWLKIIGPASCGKSTLCEALSVNRRYVIAKSTIRGFHSGHSDGSGEDHSLITDLYDKTLVTKDGDTLLQAPNYNQILAEGRDLYDCVARTHYRNRTSRTYENVRFTWLLCGTSALRVIDQSELGERFLDVVIMDRIDDDVEDEILSRVAHRARRNMSAEVDGKPETQYDVALAAAMSLTGGYIDYLRENGTVLLDAVRCSDADLQRCIRLGKFIAYMRARPSLRQHETAERELASRLVSQLTRLMVGLGTVLNLDAVTENIRARVRQVALDTARGITLDFAQLLAQNPGGLTAESLATYTNMSDSKAWHLLRFLRKIGVVELFQPKMQKPRWRLTPRLFNLYREVVSEY